MSLLAFLFVLTFSIQPSYGAEFANQGGAKKKIGNRVKLLKKNLKRLRTAMKTQDKHTQKLMKTVDVMGTATGITSEGEPVIKVFTRRPGIAGLPKSLDGFPVKVEVTGMFLAQEDPMARFPRPVPIGVSTGHPAITAGTIGARVKDAAGNFYALSNNHVYANMNTASLGDAVLQPGAVDGGTNPADKIGTLSAFEPIWFNGQSNTIDAAIALSSPAELGNSTPSTDRKGESGYGVPSSAIFGDGDGDGFFDNKDNLLGLYVQKFGRTSGMTHGQITEINVTVDVCYEAFWFWCLTWGTFVDQIGISPVGSSTFSEGGDSGSLIVSDDVDKQLVGLLFAGNGTKTLANRIDLVLDQLDVTVDGEAAEPVTDIEIASVSAPASVVEDDIIDVQVMVQNVGNQDVDDDIVVTLVDNGVDHASNTILGGLTAGASTTVIIPWSSSILGDHDLVARHDHTQNDNNPGNDSSSTMVTVEEIFIDIGVTNINAPSSVAEGENVDVFVTVENLGNWDVGDDIAVMLEDDDGFYAIDTIRGGLAVGSNAQITFTWPASSQGVYDLVASHEYTQNDDNSSNDSSSTTVAVQAAFTDIAITDISAPGSVTEGMDVNVIITVQNVGNQDVSTDILINLNDNGILYGSGTIAGGLIAGTSAPVTITWSAFPQGNHMLEATNQFNDDNSVNDNKTTLVDVTPPQTASPYLQKGKVYVYSNSWTTVTLNRDYSEMVVVCTPNYDNDLLVGTTMPVVALVRNALGNSFQVKLGQAVGGSIEISEAWVHYMVVEAGVYDLPGVRMEADTFVSTVTDNSRSWVGQSRTYQLPGGYTNPVVLGQVISNYSDMWTVFWCRGSSRSKPPSTDYLYVGKHRGEDPRARSNERIGYIVIETGSGDMDGTSYKAGLGPDTIKGVGDSPPYAYTLGSLSFTPSTAIVTQAAMDGNNGGWGILYGDTPLDSLAPDTLYLAVDEDQAWDSERRHTTEQMGYILFE
jgi:hypothetical protein